MSLSNADDTLLEREVAVKPPTRWRNWVHAERAGPRYPAGKILAPGVFVSKDVAETLFLEAWSKPAWREQESLWGYIYLGAYPEGERPND